MAVYSSLRLNTLMAVYSSLRLNTCPSYDYETPLRRATYVSSYLYQEYNPYDNYEGINFCSIAIGIADTKADAWKALWTISLHKIFVAIAMGIELLRMIPHRPSLSCASYAFAFGIVIDATTQGRVADWIFAISMGVACGVFIYISINHLL
ncbi:hypothetical protein L6452_20703 [Arctium lappa]|uniref:Uncharacterized protein n=1 Tax=Arctium lappa TaxID=4217 RepID=A0ACB9BCX9_ARCLA|nr:hypothetical protein L6452_20703 [Arctium lappa]